MFKHLIIVSFLLICTFSVKSSPIKIICSTDNPKGSLHVLALEKFGQLVANYSNHRIVTEIYYRGNKEFPAIMGEEINIDMAMKSHFRENFRIDVTVLASGNASLKANILEFLMHPYLFENKAAAIRLFQSDFMNIEVNEILVEKHNVRAIGWLVGGFRHMTNAKRPVKTLSDMKGLSIRTPRNRLMKDTYSALGAKAVPLNWAHTFEALDKGKVDGQENPYSVIIDSKFWQARQKYITKNGPFLWIGPILINEDFYQSLPKNFQQIVQRAGKEASEYVQKWLANKETEFVEQLLKNNMEIVDLKDKQKWIDATRPIWGKHYTFIGYGDRDKGKEVVDKVLSIINQY